MCFCPLILHICHQCEKVAGQPAIPETRETREETMPVTPQTSNLKQSLLAGPRTRECDNKCLLP